ncbi:MAG: TylF/MycF/NovP-related O-methyltransferase [Microthrixaceae bacterium]
MNAKLQLNRLLARTGHRLVKTVSYPPDLDPRVIEIVEGIGGRSMTGQVKLISLVEATRHLARTGVEGAMVECGVWRGGSMMAIARTLVDEGDTGRDLYLFDTFEGLPEPDEADRRVGDGASAGAMMTEYSAKGERWAEASLEDVQAGMAQVSYPPERIHYLKGLVEDTIPDGAPERIALLRLDTDWYSSTAHELDHLYDRLVPGGVLILDDYGHWEGARRAVDEFFDARGGAPLMHRIDTGRIAVKPG